MQIIHEQSTEKEKEEFFNNNPKTLCKYRSWSNDYHKKVITQAELFYSSPASFNDPYDCALPFKQHPENNDPIVILEMIERTAPRFFPGIKGQELVEKCAKQVLLIQQNPESWFELNWGYKPEDLQNTFGVLSLTPHTDNYLMWSHYADSHRGFCVEFDTRLLVESVNGHYQKVEYCDDIPLFSIRDNMKGSLITKLLYTKSKTWWEYEDEYRISKIHKPDTTVKFNPKALTGVYFGCNTTGEHQNEIINAALKLNSEIKFYKMNLDKQNFKLNKGEIRLLGSI